jgi:polyribonucleotide nucleotidyltransferase
VVAGTEHAVLMVESEAKGLSEDVMLGAVVFGHEQMQIAIRTIRELAAQAGKPRWKWELPAENAEVSNAVSLHAEAALAQAYSITEKRSHTRISEIRARPSRSPAEMHLSSAKRRRWRSSSSGEHRASASSTANRASTSATPGQCVRSP